MCASIFRDVYHNKTDFSIKSSSPESSFEKLPYLASLTLIAAYFASYNPASTDKRYFGEVSVFGEIIAYFCPNYVFCVIKRILVNLRFMFLFLTNYVNFYIFNRLVFNFSKRSENGGITPKR